ncbi:hypothetical protein [Streptomyces sp. NBC_00576]|uniref:hypothetical protein n=1 Tax=Streptomyces sp. NBC_00576 TaxID=2903665 RepID=UPI002E81F2BD|nr:hypothetical protein [Streptomyces sp. NBC_00576]WUB73317.1 hypothetical protein OG734_26370 [Streptomyces sp. NBC_00576]
MADTTDSQSQSGQHNRGPGVFIAGNVYGDVNNHQTSRPNHGRDDEPQASQEHQHNEKESLAGHQPEEANEARPGGALLGWTALTVWLIASSAYCVVAAFTAPQAAGGGVGAVLGAVLFALGGLVPLAFVFTALAEVCAVGTANSADSARKRWAQGQQVAARLNLRYAVSAARVASVSAVLVGFITGLFGFLAIGKKAADRAHDARELAESEIVKTRSALGENLDGG